MSTKRFRNSIALLIMLSAALPAAIAEDRLCSLPLDEGTHHHKKAEHKTKAPEVKHTIVVKAKPQHVWEAIQHQRKADDHRKLISYDGVAATLHETFAALPIVGEASCVYVENESTPLERIDYALIKSDHFHVFQGSWILAPGKDGSTTVMLSNEIDPGIRVPFWQDITKMAASRMVKRRLDAICAYAEQLQKTENCNQIR
ncbi:MAG: hypothetical protein K2X27_12875 [Candidatus Obscuribacterales bacterium]|nr:hypothetical protein [Candidatus Obscuribacterales bacterium]